MIYTISITNKGISWYTWCTYIRHHLLRYKTMWMVQSGQEKPTESWQICTQAWISNSKTILRRWNQKNDKVLRRKTRQRRLWCYIQSLGILLWEKCKPESMNLWPTKFIGKSKSADPNCSLGMPEVFNISTEVASPGLFILISSFRISFGWRLSPKDIRFWGS